MDSGIKILDRPTETILRLIGDKWRVLIIRDLLAGAERFNELMRPVSSITRKALTSYLRAMEQIGFIIRKIYLQAPPEVEYTLMEAGYDLRPTPDSMAAWGTAYKKNTG